MPVLISVPNFGSVNSFASTPGATPLCLNISARVGEWNERRRRKFRKQLERFQTTLEVVDFRGCRQDEDSTYYYPHPPFSVPIPRGLDREFPIAARTTPGLSV